MLKYLKQQITLLKADRDRWKNAYWDLMYKKYAGLGASYPVEDRTKFITWLEDHLLRISLVSLKSSISTNNQHYVTLKKDLSTLDILIKQKRLLLENKQRTLRVMTNEINNEMQEALESLENTKDNKETLKSPQLKLITGGKPPSIPRGSNWLLELPVGQIFICKKVGDTEFIGQQFIIDWKGDRAVWLKAWEPVNMTAVVDSIGFSRTHECIELQEDLTKGSHNDRD